MSASLISPSMRPALAPTTRRAGDEPRLAVAGQSSKGSSHSPSNPQLVELVLDARKAEKTGSPALRVGICEADSFLPAPWGGGRFGAATMKQVTTSVRSFCRFLRAHGLCDASLEAAVPTTACRQLSSLPRGLSDEQHRRLLASFRTDLPCGYRDRAIVLCLSSLGMRPGELAQLALEDIDWHAGTLRLSGRKTGRGSVLPLPEPVGTAIVDYLRHERPVTSERRVFVRHDGPYQGQPIHRGIVTGAVVRALDRSGIESPIRGAYVLRHTVACRMVGHGTSLKEVADVLGHRSLDTTAIYAKLDVAALREVALPWPEVMP